MQTDNNRDALGTMMNVSSLNIFIPGTDWHSRAHFFCASVASTNDPSHLALTASGVADRRKAIGWAGFASVRDCPRV
jgi:hypothetical protein